MSLVSRKLGKAPLELDTAERAEASHARADWNPSSWTVDQAARVLLLLTTGSEAERFVSRLDQLCATADVDELVAFYRGLPLYPDPARHRGRAAEGVRSNMKVVFEAVVHRNPYPAEQLADDAWNQMVLKALFVGSPLHPIVGLDRRANASLARMLGDYARERWAARRTISPELWRCVGPFAAGPLLEDFARVLETGSPPDRAAAVLALRGAADADARGLLDRHAALCDAVAERGVDWTSVSDFN
ncbi:MAG: EboA domain-containing protein [Rhizobacter sp.]